MERLDADSGVFSVSSCKTNSLTSPVPSVNSIDGYPTIAVEGEDAALRINALNELVNDLRLRSQWQQTVQLYGGNGAYTSSGEVTPRSSTPPARLTVVDPKLKRSISARSSLKAVGVQSPRRKKMVRFADSMGLDLEHIRHILVDDFDSAASSADSQPLNSTVLVRPQRNAVSSSSAIGAHYLVKRFSLPDGYNIPKLVDAHNVCLQSLTIMDLSVTGVIRVANIAFEKQVYVRYTLDGWATWTEVSTMFISSYDKHDLFSFSLFLPYDLPTGSRCEFCVRYSVAGRQFWDNNGDANYVLDCCSLQSAHDSGSAAIQSGWSHFLY